MPFHSRLLLRCTGCEWEGLLSLSLHGIFNALKIESSEEVIIITSVDYCQHPGDWTDEMILKHNSSPLLLTVTCMCFSGGLLWSYQEEDASDG